MQQSLDYTKIEFSDLEAELISYMQETNTFKDINIIGSNIRTFVDIFAYIGQLFGFYIYASANEVFLSTAKQYQNLVKIAELLRYEPRGVTSSNVNVVGALDPNYVFGKTGIGIGIPAYSIFPSTKQTDSGQNFQFTNIEPINYIIKSYGVNVVDQEDITYNGYSLPLTAPAAFFTSNNVVQLIATSFALPLSKYKQLRIIVKNDVTNYRGFDTTDYPLSTATSSDGQPFEKTVNTTNFPNQLLPNTTYYLVFNYTQSNQEPYLSIVSDPSILNNKEDDIIISFNLTPTDSTNAYYTLQKIDNYSFNRFYVGTLGLFDIESVTLQFDTMPNRPKSLQQIKMIVNKDGTQPPLGVLMSGTIYNFSSGTILSQVIAPDSFDLSISEYNVNLCLDSPTVPEINYGARLEITSNDPLENQVTIAKIYSQRTDPDTQTATLQSINGNRFGDIQVVEAIDATTSNQKNGKVTFSGGMVNTQVIFNKPFTSNNYNVSLDTLSNVKHWYANQNVNGFTIYVEPNTNFSGDISWVATETIPNNLTQMDVHFDTPIPQVLENNALVSNYMVALTPNDDINVWYENLTSEGFTIKTSRNFLGKVSWSVYNYFTDDYTPTENIKQTVRQNGKVALTNITTYDVSLEVPINDQNYAVQLNANDGSTVWYTNKSSKGFTINIEPTTSINKAIIVNWYVDDSVTDYVYQAHGEIQFKGQTTLNNYIPGMSFINIPESFDIDNLYEGSPLLSHINTNLVIDTTSNSLKLSLDPHRVYETDTKFIVGNSNISANTIRVFVKNENNTWDEWKRAGFSYNQTVNVGEEVFKVLMNSDSYLCVEFGNGTTWGTSIQGSEVVIFGHNSVGSGGNIIKGTLAPNVVLSQYILGNDITTVDFEQNLIDLIGLKSSVYFSGNNIHTSIIDSEGTSLKFSDLTITQNQNSFGGNDVETSDELRQNATNFFVTQNRLVSLDDYSRYIVSTFSDYLVKAQVLSYKDAQSSGLIPASEFAKYFFNYVFVIGLNKDGSNTISKNLRDFISDNLNNTIFKMVGSQATVYPATWMPIDVAIKYSKTKGGSYQTIETQMKNNLAKYFADYSLHNLGETIYHSTICSLVDVDNVQSFEVMINKNPNNKLQSNDYSVNFSTTDTDINVATRNKLMSLVAKDPSLVKVFQPLFETINVDGSVTWNYSLDIVLNAYEFPQLGNIVIARAN